jgi:hypothetical protein
LLLYVLCSCVDLPAWSFCMQAVDAAGGLLLSCRVMLQRYICWMHTTPTILLLVKMISTSISRKQVRCSAQAQAQLLHCMLVNGSSQQHAGEAALAAGIGSLGCMLEEAAMPAAGMVLTAESSAADAVVVLLASAGAKGSRAAVQQMLQASSCPY